MARNTTLLSLIAQFRAETGRKQDVSVGVSEVENIKNLLRRTQQQLYEKFDWPFLEQVTSVSLAAGTRYYDLPTDLNFDRITEIALEYNNNYYGVERGINFDDYASFDSNADTPERSSPVVKWDIRNTGSGEQIEVWPMPNDDNQTLYFKGIKKLGDLIQEDDTADLDDTLIVLHAAAQRLKRQKSADADVVQQLAVDHYNQLTKNSKKLSRPIQKGLGAPRMSNRGSVKIVVS